jgi:hypothetical protein
MAPRFWAQFQQANGLGPTSTRRRLVGLLASSLRLLVTGYTDLGTALSGKEAGLGCLREGDELMDNGCSSPPFSREAREEVLEIRPTAAANAERLPSANLSLPGVDASVRARDSRESEGEPRACGCRAASGGPAAKKTQKQQSRANADRRPQPRRVRQEGERTSRRFPPDTRRLCAARDDGAPLFAPPPPAREWLSVGSRRPARRRIQRQPPRRHDTKGTRAGAATARAATTTMEMIDSPATTTAPSSGLIQRNARSFPTPEARR